MVKKQEYQLRASKQQESEISLQNDGYFLRMNVQATFTDTSI